MKIAVISDTHDHFYNLNSALEIIKNKKIDICFHLGDFCAPGFVREMFKDNNIKWYCVWGNVDGAKAKILLEQKDNIKFDISEESFREILIEKRKIFLTHFPLLAKHAAQSSEYDAVFYGDNHTQKIEKKGKTLVVNPGELSGFKTNKPGFAIWDTDKNDIETISLVDYKISK